VISKIKVMYNFIKVLNIVMDNCFFSGMKRVTDYL
jgi:hypothetical protein